MKLFLFFLPEIVLYAFACIRPELLEAFMISVAKTTFGACTICLASKQFLLSSSILLIFIVIHLIRLLLYSLKGKSLLEDYVPTLHEVLISLLVLIAYIVFLIDALNVIPLSAIPRKEDASISLVDIIGFYRSRVGFYQTNKIYLHNKEGIIR